MSTQQEEKQAVKPQQEQQQKQQSGEKINDWRTKVNWEKIYKYISFTVIALVPFFVLDMIKFREQVNLNKLNYHDQSIILYTFIACAIFTGVRKLFFITTHNFIYSKILPQYQGVERDLHTKKVQKWAFDFIYYSATTIYAAICFRNASWYPLSFTQTEEPYRGLFQNYPDLPVNESYYKFYEPFLIVQFGHHIWGILDLVLVRRKLENRFYEWFLHHLLAFTLLCYSIFFNLTILSIAVLIIHDIGDIFIVMFKMYGEFSDKGFSFKYLVFQMIVGWFVTRVYLYPKVIIYPIIQNKADGNVDGIVNGTVNAAYIYQTLMLTMLYFLHIYWFACMLTLLTSYVKKQLKSGKNKKSSKGGYGNEWDYHHYTDADKKKKQQEEQEKNKKQN